jgi:glycosyltransferase involved in cell wall biosynthesis
VRFAALRLLVFNLAMDLDHPLLGFTSRWIDALSLRVEHLHVVTMTTGRVSVGNNVHVHSLGKERHLSEPRRAFELYRIVSIIVLREHVDACFCHMALIFPIMTAPLLKSRRIPIVTWYAATEMSMQVRVAHLLSDRIVTSVAPAYPYRHDEKLRVVGQGIDTNLFRPDPPGPKEEPRNILCVGRLSPIKDHPTLFEAVRLLLQRGIDVCLTVVGDPAPSAEDYAYAGALKEQVGRMGIDDWVEFVPAVPLAQIPLLNRRATLHVNMTPTGSGDKTVLEAMCCGTPSIVANEGFRETFGPYWDLCSFRHGSAADLANRLAWWLSRPAWEVAKAGESLRERVVDMHGLEGLADRLIHQLREVAAKEGQEPSPCEPH